MTGELDSFLPSISSNDWPRCTLPFKELKILWNGNVPLCKYSHLQTKDEIGIHLGNVNTDSIVGLWNHPTMKQYRNAHRKRLTSEMPICRGCFGTWCPPLGLLKGQHCDKGIVCLSALEKAIRPRRCSTLRKTTREFAEWDRRSASTDWDGQNEKQSA